MQCENRTPATDALKTMCSYPNCFFPSGPCKTASELQYASGACVGTSTYAAPANVVDRTNIHRALSATVEAMKNMTSVNLSDDDRLDIFITTIINIRDKWVGDLRLTSLARVCCVCGKYLGTKEGNGATGETAGYCSECASARVGSMVHNPAEIEDEAEKLEADAFRKVYTAICSPHEDIQAMTLGIRNVMSASDDKRDAAAIENAALI